jgi:hypothetical protein
LKSWEFTWVPWLQTWECLPMQTDVEEIGCYYSTLQSKQIFHKKEKRVSLLWRLHPITKRCNSSGNGGFS